MERSEKIRLAIQELRDKKGRVTPRMVVDAARAKNHVLHDEFDWDDVSAADKHRLDRARELIRYVVIEVISRSEKSYVPIYVRDVSLPKKTQGYVTLESVTRAHALSTVLAEMERCQAAIERARAVADALDAKHPGVALKLEAMLAHCVNVRGALQEAAE